MLKKKLVKIMEDIVYMKYIYHLVNLPLHLIQQQKEKLLKLHQKI